MIIGRSPRRTSSSLVLLLSALVMAACGTPAVQQTTSQPGTGTNSVPDGFVDTSAYKKSGSHTVCFSNASVSNSWRVAMVEHLRYEVSRHPEIGTFRATDANDQPEKQSQDIDDLLQQGCDVLIVSPAQSNLTAAVNKATAQGVPVVLVDRKVDDGNYVTFVDSSSCELGRTQAEWLVTQLNHKGNIVLLSGVKGATPAEERLRCAREVFKKHPDIKELAQAYVNWSPLEGKQVTSEWLAQFSQIDGVWADGLQGVGAVEAFVEQNKKVPPVTADAFNRFFKLWQQHKLDAIAVSYPVRMGQVAVTTALEILAGKPVPHLVDVPRTVVTNENLTQYVRNDLPDDYWTDSDPELVKILFPTE